MTRLSVNLNKIALIRNARGTNFPNLLEVAKDCETFGAHGITVHPRPDERHIRKADIPALKEVVTTELNVEGNPTKEFLDLVLSAQPDQVTLVPDAPGALTSDSGWDTIQHQSFLREVIGALKAKGIRVSIFIDPDSEKIRAAADTGTDRIELYTGPYAHAFAQNNEQDILRMHSNAAQLAHELGLGVNAGHDLNLDNLKSYKQAVNPLHEVSIGHALTVDALYFGLDNVIKMYLLRLAE